MAYDDLREFLKALDEQGQLLRITDEVMPEPDIAAAANAAPRLGENAPALYFDNVKGFTTARIAMRRLFVPFGATSWPQQLNPRA